VVRGEAAGRKELGGRVLIRKDLTNEPGFGDQRNDGFCSSMFDDSTANALRHGFGAIHSSRGMPFS
jgi:hypothetical protein